MSTIQSSGQTPGTLGLGRGSAGGTGLVLEAVVEVRTPQRGRGVWWERAQVRSAAGSRGTSPSTCWEAWGGTQNHFLKVSGCEQRAEATLRAERSRSG